MKLFVTRCDEYKGWFSIQNRDEDRDKDDWDETYVRFSGHFGPYGPELFARAPETEAELEKVLVANAELRGMNAELRACIDAGIAQSKSIIAELERLRAEINVGKEL